MFIITQVQKLKINLVTLQTYSNGTYLRNRLPNLSLFLPNLFLAELLFKIGSLKLFNMEPTFRYRKIPKFRICIKFCKIILIKSLRKTVLLKRIKGSVSENTCSESSERVNVSENLVVVQKGYCNPIDFQ